MENLPFISKCLWYPEYLSVSSPPCLSWAELDMTRVV